MLARTLTVLIILFTACSKQKNLSLPTEVIKHGEIKLKISPSAKSLRTCDLLELSVEITYPQAYKVKLPDSKDNFGDFSIYQINQNSPVAVNEKLNSLSQIIILEPGLPATHKIPALPFSFWDEKNVQSTFKSKALEIAITSSLNAEKNKDIEDIIIETKKANHSVTIIGTTVLLGTVLYLLLFCKPEEDMKETALKEALADFQDLSKLNEHELMQNLPKSCCTFLKEKFSLQKLPNNLDIIIKELATKQELKSFSEKLNELYLTYNKLRYSSKNIDKNATRELFSTFDSLFQEIQV